MVPPELISYIDSLKALKVNPSREALRKTLQESGWTGSELEESLNYFFGEAPTVKMQDVPSETVPHESPVLEDYVLPDWALPEQPIQATIKETPKEQARPQSVSLRKTSPVPQVFSAEVSTVPLTRSVSTEKPPVQRQAAVPLVRPLKATTPSPAQESPLPLLRKEGVRVAPQKGKKSFRVVSVVVIVLILLGGGTAYAYMEAVGPFARPPVSKDAALAATAHHLANLDSSIFTSSFTIESMPRGSQGASSDAWNFLFTFLPPNFRAAFSVEGGIDAATSDAGNVTGELRFDDTLAVFDFEFVRKGDVLFAKVNKFPSFLLPGSVEKIQGTWIRFDSADLAEMGGLPDSASTISLESAEPLRLASIILAEAAESGFLTAFGEPIREDGGAYKYSFTLQPEKLEVFWRGISRELLDHDIRLPDVSADQIEESIHLLTTSEDTLLFAVWLNRKKELVKMSITNSAIPPEWASLWQGRELVSTIIFEFSESSPDHVSGPPTEFISAEQAILLLSGLSREEYALEQQERRIEEIQGALEYYALTHESVYPDSLEVLANTRVRPLWKDAYTGEPFTYTKIGTDYALRYEVQFPPYAPEHIKYFAVLEGNKAYLKYISGLNTAKSNSVSVEAAFEAEQDKDKDGVADSLEAYMGTDPSLKDSDRDGISDFAEIIQSSDL